ALLNVQGIDVHAEDKNKQTPLHWATDERIVNALIAQGAKVNAEDKNKQTPLHWAVKDCNTAVIWALINNNAEVNAKDKNKQTPLHLAVKGGNTAVIWALIDNKAKVNAKDKNKQIPLHWAASGKVARYLIIQGAEVNAIDNDENTPLHLAAEKGYITVIKALLDKEANIHAKNKAGRTPLYYSANVDIKNALIAAGAKDVPVAEVHSKDKEDIPLQDTTME
ncbi:Ankyrin repeat-containing domain,Ankyrin repeat, partial [Cinara cedri]